MPDNDILNKWGEIMYVEKSWLQFHVFGFFPWNIWNLKDHPWRATLETPKKWVGVMVFELLTMN